jgi:hypothetical protein
VLALSTNLVNQNLGGSTNEILDRAGEQAAPGTLPDLSTPSSTTEQPAATDTTK